MSVEVRPMGPGDLDGAVQVWQSANTARGKPPTPERVARVVEKLRDPTATAYVATDADAVLGMALLEPYRADDGGGEVVPGVLHLSMVFIAPSWQGRRLGTQLVRYALDQARAAGVARVSLWTGSDNTGARQFYERLGMKHTHTRQISQTASWARYETDL